ncbi:MAG TPA: phage tail protein [Nitrososphaera sp.]|nr:phage tail protein [Nitrososphaera sp.]
MAKFSVNTNRYDPYKNFKFRIKLDNKYVAGLTKVSALTRTTEVIEFREGGNPSLLHKIPGRTSFAAVTLEEGVTHDSDFESWANMVYNVQGDAATSPKRFRKDIILELLNEQGVVVMAYRLYRCWVSEYQALPELDANSSKVAIRSIRIENEGWERDTSIPEPAES